MLGLPVNENQERKFKELDGDHQPQNLLIKKMNEHLDNLEMRDILPK